MDELNNLLNNYKSDTSVPLHKQFEIIKFNNTIETASREQAIALAKEAFKAMVIREAITSELVKHSWGLDLDQAA